MPETLNLLTISGSLRADSLNTALLDALPELSPKTLNFERLDWSSLPVFNEDLESPPELEQISGRIRESDGLVIATPEYNKGVPGGLKNLIDWVSTGPSPHALLGTPVALLGVSGGVFGTTMSQAALRLILAGLGAPTMPAPQVMIGPASQRFDDARRLVHQPTRDFVAKWAVEVERWMGRFPQGSR